jgi:penicillin-binding protein 1A
MEHGEREKRNKHNEQKESFFQQSANRAKKAVSGAKDKIAKVTEKKGERPKKVRTKEQRRHTWFIVGTVALILVLTIAMFAGIFMVYVNKVLKGSAELDLSEYSMSMSTELYNKNPDTGEWEMYQTLYQGKDRIWVDYDKIPENLWKAAVAIEDKRFFTHHGVDWNRTASAVFNMFLGMRNTFGGSTITQQLIKNVTEDDEVTVKRKVTEIFRALDFEKQYTKEEILEMYLNTIYLGNSCYGASTAATNLYNKDVSQLSLAECACMIGITNNPSIYNPLRNAETLANNREREVTILSAMLKQKWITQEEYDAAVNEDVAFTNGTTILGNSTQVQEVPDPNAETTPVESKAKNSYFTDQVITDVVDALIEKYGYTNEVAENKLFSGGYKIYTTENPKVQDVAEDVFENTDYYNDTDSHGNPLELAMTVVDPYTGDVVAMVGGTGAKTIDRGWNWATSPRQCGSAIKPLATYAPALDDGTITAASIIDDYPVRVLDNKAWPKNSHGSYTGFTTIQTAITNSINTVAVRVNEMYGVTKSYQFLTQKLGFTTLEEGDINSAALGLGGFTNGVTTEDMAAAYASFVNDGVYTKPRTFIKVEDGSGNVILENESASNVAMKETTAYLMRGMLQNVVSGGTGTEARFSGMSIGGKTGTTDTAENRYFVGFTPYYCAAVWCGYESNEDVNAGGNPAAVLWRQVMSRVHEGLSDPGFHSVDSSELTTVTVCASSGMLATDECAKDPRGSQVRTVVVAKDTAPTQPCTMHQSVSYCADGKCLATASCPASSLTTMVALNYNREVINDITTAESPYLLQTLKGTGVCAVHGGTTLPGTTTPGTEKPGETPTPGGTQPEGGSTTP